MSVTDRPCGMWKIRSAAAPTATDRIRTGTGERNRKKILAEGIQADEILCSPLSRAKDTAQLISEMTGIPCRVEPRLIEQNFGKWESTPRDGEDFKKAKEFFACSHEGGESTLRLAQRIYNLLDDIRKNRKKKLTFWLPITESPELCSLILPI